MGETILVIIVGLFLALAAPGLGAFALWYDWKLTRDEAAKKSKPKARKNPTPRRRTSPRVRTA